MQPAIVMVPLIVSMMAGGGFIVNEWSHGGLSESMGMGHHHMLDYGRQHCEDMEGNMVHMTSMPGHDGAHAESSMPGAQACADGNHSMGGRSQ